MSALNHTAYFGKPEPVDWRKTQPPDDPDDGEIQTPEDVRRALGFDLEDLEID